MTLEKLNMDQLVRKDHLSKHLNQHLSTITDSQVDQEQQLKEIQKEFQDALGEENDCFLITNASRPTIRQKDYYCLEISRHAMTYTHYNGQSKSEVIVPFHPKTDASSEKTRFFEFQMIVKRILSDMEKKKAFVFTQKRAPEEEEK